MSAPERGWYVPARGYVVGFEARDGQDFLWARFPGEGDVLVRPLDVDDLDDPTISAAYEAHLTGAPGPVGTPLAELGLERPVIKDMEHKEILSVEALAALNDTVCMKIREGFTMKRKAQAYLAERKVAPGAARELDELRKQIAGLQAQLIGGAK